MANPYFQFKQFTVWHDRCAMKVNTDAVLLGAWASAKKATTILDIGTGSGIIAIMLAQRSNAYVTGVELDKNAACQALENASKCPWKERMEINHIDFNAFANICDTNFDLVVSNPPYFLNSLLNNDVKKQMARHANSLTSAELIGGAFKILTENGIFAVILPEEQKGFEQEAAIAGLYCHRKLLVKTLPTKKFTRQLLEFSKIPKLQPELTELCIHATPKEYSPEYKQLTKDFYLNF